MSPPVSSPSTVVPSIDELFIETSFATAWQTLLLVLMGLSLFHTGIIVISPTFYRVTVPYVCSDNLDLLPSNETQATCSQGSCQKWTFDYSDLDVSTSIQESFNLVCGDEIFLELHGSCYFLGLLLGSAIGGFMSDRIGRVKWVRISYLLCTVFCVTMATTSYLVIYLASWVVVSSAIMSSWICMFPLSSEVGKRSTRQASSSFLGVVFGVGTMFCAPLAYFFPNWRHLMLSIAVISLFAFALSLLFDESPRWLWTKRRYEEVAQIMEKASRLRGRELPASTKKLLEELSKQGIGKKGIFGTFVDDLKRIVGMETKENGSKGECGETLEAEKQYSIFNVFGYGRLTLRLFLLALHWICVNTLYYGIVFGAKLFKQQLHWYVFFQGIACITGSVLLLISLKSGRKSLTIFCLVTAGFGYLVCIFVPPSYKVVNLVLSFVAKVVLQLLFLLIYTWTSEMMPTVVRTSSVGSASLVARITGLAVPFVGNLATIWVSLPLVFYSGFAFLVVICSVLLPETKGKSLPNTMEEGNVFSTRKDKNSRAIDHSDDFKL